jgi:Ca2+-binding RTX toxin-like protein
MVRIHTPTDPLYLSQWHHALVGRLSVAGLTFKGLERVWADHTGVGVKVGVWDDGIQKTHWDLSGNYNSSRHVTINGTLNDGQPLTDNDGHGTSASGLIAADDNGLGGVGVAFDAQLTSIRIFGGADDINSNWSRYLQTLDSLSKFDVTNHSYGGYPDFGIFGDVAKFQASAVNGRGGLGTLNVKSAGNDDVDGNGDALDSSRFTITVGALDTTGQVTYYSTYGAHLLVSAPAGSVTTDRLGTAAGYNGLLGGDYTDKFGGTSAAGPVTAGVVALVLDANETLGWRDVQNILSYSAIGTGSLYTGVTSYEGSTWKGNGASDWNGGGLHYSEDYGYGMVNALNAVRMAEVWSILFPIAATSANEVVATAVTTNINRAIADMATLNYQFNVTQNVSLEHVALTVDLDHDYFTDLRLRLVSPDGTVMTLYEGSTGDSRTADYGLTYTFGIDGLRGEMSAGTWTLQIQDADADDTGTLNSINFKGYGSAVITDDDVYHYTDEVLLALQQSGQDGRMTLLDSDEGVDWIDAAAVYQNLVLDLNDGATSTLAGTSFLTIAATSEIENAIGGDGNDIITGNEFDNLLYGMRGDDALDGGLGNDTAVFIGDLADYVIESSGGVTTLTHATFGIDTLVGFEWIAFDDQTIADPSLGPAAPDETAPTLVSFSPADNAIDVEMNANIVLTFSENVQAGAGNFSIYAGGALWATISAASANFSGRTATLDPLTNMDPELAYYVLVDDQAVTDLAGNAFAGISSSSTFNFTTKSDFNVITGTNRGETLNGTAGADAIFGLAGGDKLNGGAGDDLLDGGAGNDTMAGGAGDDSYVVDANKDKVVEGAGAGTDLVRTTLASFTLGSNVENLAYNGASSFRGIGNSLNNEITGNSGSDVLTGNSGNDVLVGGGGGDALQGGTGLDLLIGGDGADWFVFGSISEAGLGATRDVIQDFASGSDKIDLSLIDANSAARGNQAFSSTLVSTFTGVKAQLSLTISGGDLIVSGDVNGDARADFEIMVVGLTSLASSDFIL